MNHNKFVWIIVWFLTVHVSSCLFKFGICRDKKEKIVIKNKLSNNEQIPKLGTAIVLPVMKQKVPSIAEYITAIILRYLYPRLSTSHFLTHFQNEETNKIDHMLLSQNQRFLFIAGCDEDFGRSYECCLKVWDLEKNKCVRKYKYKPAGRGSPIEPFSMRLSLSNDDSVLVAQCDTYTQRVFEPMWNSDTHRYGVAEFRRLEDWEKFVYNRKIKEIKKIYFLLLIKSNIPCMRDPMIGIIFSFLKSRQSQQRWYMPMYLSFFNDRQYVVSSRDAGSDKPAITAWVKDSQDKYCSFEGKLRWAPFLKVTEDQQWLIACTDGMPSTIKVWNFITRKLQEARDVYEHVWSEMNCVISDKNWVAVGYTHMLEIYSVPQLVSMCTIHCGDMTITSCAHVENPTTDAHIFALAGALAGYDGAIELWSCAHDFTSTERMHRIINASTKYVNTCCFIMNGEKLLSAGEDTKLRVRSTLKVWDVKTGALIENDKDE